MTSPMNQDSSLSGIETDQQFNFKCKFCFRNLSSRQNLREHLYIHTDEKPYICTEPGCGQKFRQGSLLSLHKKIHLEVKKSQKKDNNSQQRCKFPKLTDLLQADSNLNIEDNMEESVKIEWLTKIGEETFLFAVNFLKE